MSEQNTPRRTEHPTAPGSPEGTVAVPDGAEAGAVVGAATRAAVDTAGDRAVAPMAAVSTDHTTELNNIDFRKMIGGPLQAAVDAQVASSMATIDFIRKVGFTQPDEDGDGGGELVMVDFTHERKDYNDANELETSKVFVRVPLLAMLPIPSLRIEHVIIDFNVKLNSVESASTEDSLGIDASLGIAYGPVNFKVSASYQRKTATAVEVKKEYALNVNVKAVQDEMPAGLERILGMLAA